MLVQSSDSGPQVFGAVKQFTQVVCNTNIIRCVKQPKSRAVTGFLGAVDNKTFRFYVCDNALELQGVVD